MKEAAPTSWWRLWAIQGSWNRQTLQNLGWLVAMFPWLRSQKLDAAGRAQWMSRFQGASNSNPYVVGFVLGAALRLEADGRPTAARPLADSLSRTLGALGDALFWTGLRPAWALWTAVAALLWGWAAAVVGWLTFAVAAAWVRQKAFDVAWQRGAEAAKLLAHPRVHAGIGVARGMALAGGGALTALVAYRGFGEAGIGAILASLAVGSVIAWRRWSPGRCVVATVLVVWVWVRIFPGVGA